jgi:hypothetical protein
MYMYELNILIAKNTSLFLKHIHKILIENKNFIISNNRNRLS